MTDQGFDTMDELEELVRDNEGLFVAEMGELRYAVERERLGNGALVLIEDGLRARALGHYPELTLERHDEIRIYKIGTPVGVYVETVLYPSTHGDKLLKEAASQEAVTILQRVRQLVSE